MVGSAALFAVMGVAVKTAAAELPNAMLVFFRNAVGLVMFVPWLLRGGREAFATARLRDHLTRGLSGVAAMYFFFYAIGRMRLADALSLSYTMPLFMPLIARFWLKEAVPPRLGGILALGFAGVLLILKPGLGVFQPVALAALISGFLGSIAQVGIRGLTRTEPPARIVFYFSLIATLVSAVPLIPVWETPSPFLWCALLAVGVLATIAQLLLTRAYKWAPPAQVGPFLYTALVFAGLLDWLVWGQAPDLFSLSGAVCVGLAGALMIRRAGAQAAPSETVEK